MQFSLNSTSQSVDVLIVDDSGLPVTGLVASTFPTLIYSLAGAHASVSFPALSDLAAITTLWAAGGIKERSGGRYRLDCPDEMFAIVGNVQIIGEETDKRAVVPVIEVVPSPVVVGPITSSSDSSGLVVEGAKITAYHYAPVEAGPFEILDDDGEPLDMSAYATDLSFVVFSTDGVTETKIAQVNYPIVTVSGLGEVSLATAGTTTLTATIGRLRYGIRRRTSGAKFVRAHGEFIVKPMADVT